MKGALVEAWLFNFKLREGWCPALDISRAGTLLVLLNRNIRGNEKTLYREEDELDTLSWERTHSVQRQRGDMSLKLRSRCTFNLIFRFTLFYILCFVQFNRICFLFCVGVCCAGQNNNTGAILEYSQSICLTYFVELCPICPTYSENWQSSKASFAQSGILVWLEIQHIFRDCQFSNEEQ